MGDEGEAFVLGGFLGIVVTLMIGFFISLSVYRSLQKEAVEYGYAEWHINESLDVEFRWIEGKEGANEQ